jgi:hypothetical protein
MKKMLLHGPVLVLLVLIMACQNVIDSGSVGETIPGPQRSVSDASGNTYLLPYSPYNYEVLLSKFVAAENDRSSNGVIAADGRVNEPVWNGASSSAIRNFKHPTSPADPPEGYSTEGTTRSVWNGYTLYVAVKVQDSTSAPENTQLTSSTDRSTRLQSASWNNFDAVEFDLDFFNDKIDKWELDDGMFKISRSGKLANRLLPDAGQGDSPDDTWADPLADPRAREFTDRLKDWGAYEVANGYEVWLAIEREFDGSRNPCPNMI